MRLGVWITAVSAMLGLGCGSGGDEPPAEPQPVICSPGEWQREDGVCIPAGLPPDMPCSPGEWQRDGVCVAAGVPPDGCGEGFVHDGDRGCDPILPSDACAPGFMAVPGETVCREVAPCAPGRWGDIPVEPDTQYVDASYANMDSDGSALKPWTSIQVGVDAAAPLAIVAIASGSYLEDVTVSGKAVRLWGVCPELVEVVGTGMEPAAVQVLSGAAASEVRSLAIRGDGVGVLSSGSLDAVLARVWIHDNAGRGIDVENVLGPTSMTLDASLVEQNQQLGAFVEGSSLTVEASVVRATQPTPQGVGGVGVHVQSTNAPAALLVRRSLVEQSHDFGVAIHGGQATVEASVVRGTLPNAQGLGGRGLNAQPLGSIAGSLLLRQSLVEQNHEVGVFVAGAELTVEASVVRDTQPETPGTAGVGVNAQAHPDGAASTLLLLTSLVERNHAVGVFVTGSNATVEASAVRNTEPDDMGLGGLGIGAQADEITGAASTLTLKSSLVEQSRSTGVLVEGSSATIEACAVRDTQPDTFGHFGRGVNVEPTVMTATPATLALHASLVENSHEVGVYIAGSEALVEASVVRATELGVLGRYSRGVNAQASMPTTAPSNLVLKSSLIEQNHECGVIITNSTATIESCAIRDTASNADGEYGDGLAVVAAAIPASASVTNTRISTSARAGLLAHSAHVALSESALTCHAFDLDSESSDLGPATLEDLGGNLCGCPEATARCAARSANLAPPPSVEPTTTP